MRPRHYAAENVLNPLQVVIAEPLASMRPRHYAAENTGESDGMGIGSGASMRPRHYAAENYWNPRQSEIPNRPASMRPRHYAAENLTPARRSCCSVRLQ